LLKQQHKKLTIMALPVRPVSANVAFQCVMMRADIWLTDNTPQSYRTCRSIDTV